MEWAQVLASRSSRMKASETREFLKLLDQPDILSFAGGIPDPQLIPTQAFRAAFAGTLEGGGASAALQFSVSEGYKPLRGWIAGQMAAIGVPCTPDNIVITSGSQQALDYLGKLMLSPQDTVLLGLPTYLGALGALNAYEPVYDRLDPQANRTSPDLAAKALAAGNRVKLADLSVDFANPSGATLGRRAREAVIDLADSLDIAIVEDAAYQALRYDGEAIPPILALEIARKGGIVACRTLYCGSFSKSLATGLRAGWGCGASTAISRLVLMKQAADLHSATINQTVTYRAASTIFDAHVATLRQTYQARRDHMLKALAREMPAGVTWTRPKGGMFVWLTLPAQLEGADLLAKSLQAERVAFGPGRAFFADGSNSKILRLSFACADATAIDEGIKRLGRLISAQSQT